MAASTFATYPAAKLEADVFADTVKKAPTRDGWGKALAELGRSNPNIVVATADVSESVRTHWFEKEFPGRFVQCGVAEQNMAGVAAGMAMEGKIAFFSAYGVFSPGRNWDQIRVCIAYNNLNVKFSGAHAGITVGPDGATHQAMEDMALMRALPNVCVVCPADEKEAGKAAKAAAERPGPVYIRLGREKTAIFTTDASPFEIGKINVLKEGKDVAIVACGVPVYEALKAAKKLGEEGIDAAVLNCHTVKPIDRRTLADYARRCGCVVTAEEHQITGGLGGAVAEALSEDCPTPMVRVGMPDRFGESGDGLELLKHFGMGADGIHKAAKEAIAKKKK
ncbi:MAG: transketolase family protein [Candidatus Micrarchaeota archaeon]|nr:transketolase family protein [Candidatus Micrarchaeota archaeon]